MKRRFKHKLTAAVLTVAVVGSTLLPGFTPSAQAAINEEWNPLYEWEPGNGQSFDPVAEAMQGGLGGQAKTAMPGSTPVTEASEPDVVRPQEPIDVSTGSLVFSEKDFSYDSFGPALEVARSYNGKKTDRLSLFGYGWTIPQERYLEMFDDFAIADQQADGSVESYTYEKWLDPEEAIVESYDGDPLIYYPLHQGEYHPADASSRKTLTRRGAQDYLLVDAQTGMRYAFKGYKAAWRSQPADAGKLMRYADRTGLVMYISYDGQGRISQLKGNVRPTLTFAYGSNGLVSTVTDYGGLQYRYAYDDSKNLTKITRPDGSTLEMNYDGQHRITARIENGVRTTYVYTGDKVTAIKDALERTVYSYEYAGNTVTKTDYDGNQTVYTIGADKKIAKRVDPNGLETSFTYNAEGKVTSITTPNGTTTMEYDSNGNLTSRVEPGDRELRMEYEDTRPATFDKPTKIVEPGGATWAYTYTDDGTVETVTDPFGHVSTNTVDSFWEAITKRTDDQGRTSDFDYNAYRQMTSVTDANGKMTTFDYDDSGRLEAVHYSNGAAVTMQYEDGELNPSTVTGPENIAKHYEYDQGRLESETDENGVVTDYVYNELGLLKEKIVDGDRTTAYTYTVLGQLDTVTYPDGRHVDYDWYPNGRLKKKSGLGIITTEYEYDLYGNVTKISTPQGEVEYERDDAGRLTALIDPLGNRTAYTYNAMGLVSAMTDAKGNTTEYLEYDVTGQLTKMQDPLGGVTEYVYDDLGNLTQVTDPQGRVTTYEYDQVGELKSMTDAEGRVTSYVTDYNDLGHRVVTETFQGLSTIYEYDLAERLIKETNAEGEDTTHGYDDKGQLLEVIDPMGYKNSFTYDEFGNLESRTDPNGNTYLFAYDAAGRVTEETDPKLHKIEYQYDLLHRTTKVIKEKYPQEVYDLYEYDEAGNMTAHTDARGNKTTYEYDAANHLRKIITTQGVTEYVYDELGRMTEEIDPLRNRTKYEYDELGRLTKMTDKEDAETTYFYDPLGAYVEATLPNGKIVRTDYNKVGQVVQEQDAAGGLTKYEYNEEGRLHFKTNARGAQAEYTYDNVGRLTAIEDPLGFVTNLTYDDNGNLLTRSNPLGFTWGYAYDDGNRLVKMVDPMEQVAEFQYDKNDNLTKYIDVLDRETEMSYDASNRLVEKIDPANYKTTYEYDAQGNLVKEIDSEGKAIEYAYDELNRLTQVKDREGKISETVYDAAGNVLKEIDRNRKATAYDYDKMGRLTDVIDATNHRTTYVYDKMGNEIEQHDALGRVTKWTYDGVGRMLSEKDPLGAVTTYEYDMMGNLTAEVDPAHKRTEYVYDPRQLLTQIKYANGTAASFTYDEAGRLKTASNPASSEEYVYDELDRVKSVTNHTLGKTISYDYDEVGNRTKITDPEGLVISYTYDTRGNMLTMTDPEGLVTSYTYDAFNQVTEMQGGDMTVTSYDYDHNRRPTQIRTTTPTGLLSSYAYTYDGEGNILTQTEEDGAVTKYTYDDLYRLVEVQYPKEKIQTIRNTYYTPPLSNLFPDGADGSGDTDTTAPTFPDPTAPQFNIPFPKAGGNSGKGGGSSKGGGTTADPTPSKPTPGKGNGGGGKDNSGSHGNTGGHDNAGGNGKGNSHSQEKGNNGKGHAYGKNKDRYGDSAATYPDYSVELGYPENYVPDDPDFFLNPVEKVTYTYDAVGNRTSMTDDYGLVTYTYDDTDKLVEVDGDEYKYDAAGNLASKTTPYGDVTYSYNGDNLLTQVSYVDDTYVKYDYDAFGRKVYREEQYYDLNGPGASMGGEAGNDSGNGNGNGYGRDNNPGQGHAYGHEKNAPHLSVGKGIGQGAGKSNGKGNAGGNGKGHAGGNSSGGSGDRISNYHLKQEVTNYLYDGNTVLNEYNQDGEAYAQYYQGANNQIVARQMFGFQGRKEQGYLGNLRDRGHKLFYHYDATGNVTDLTDHLGSTVLKYRYDAFGGVFTQLWTPYNNVGLTGKSYDIKASLMDYGARWYSPSVGRFTSKDTWQGVEQLPQTLNRYAYTLNNPINLTDPTGHMPCYIDDNGNTRCGYADDPDDWGNYGGGGGTGGGGSGGDSGGSTGGDDGSYDPPTDPDPLPEEEPAWMHLQDRVQEFAEAVGLPPTAAKVITELIVMGADSVPIVSNILDGIRAITGFDPFTGEKLSGWERTLAGFTALLPGAGGVKAIMKLVDKAVDGYKAVKKVRTANNTVGDIRKATKADPPATPTTRIGCGQCFPAGTKVETEDGPKAIEKLEIGDKVLAKSDITGEIGYKEVEKTFTRVADDVYTLTVGEEGDQVQVTGDHPFYVHDIGWVRTSNLQVGDELDTRWDGWALEIKDIKVEKKETRVYNLTVADFHTFFVSDLQIFTHNETCTINWNNGWRTSDGKFASPAGAGKSGAEAEEDVWNAIKQKPGWKVEEGRVYVKNANGDTRVYDGVAISPSNRVIGLEVKSGNATKTASQRKFDNWVNESRDNRAIGVGSHDGLEVQRVIEIRR